MSNMTTSVTQLTTAKTISEDLLIPSDTAGIELHLRNKRPATLNGFSERRTVVLMHGATYCSISLFDVPFEGVSFLDHFALAGYDVYAVDVRGYGGSSRPPELEKPADEHAPVVRTETGVRDLSCAIDFVLERRGLERLNLFAMSWGGSVAGSYTTLNNRLVRKLALLAPQWLSATPSKIDPGGRLGAYRLIDLKKVKQHWLADVPEEKREDFPPDGWFEQWAETTLATDPLNAVQAGAIRAVNGPVVDAREYWSAGRKIYEPSQIAVPVLLVHGEWDRSVPIESALDYFKQLKGARYRRWVEIGEGTHMIALEKNRFQVFDAVQQFFDEEY